VSCVCSVNDRVGRRLISEPGIGCFVDGARCGLGPELLAQLFGCMFGFACIFLRKGLLDPLRGGLPIIDLVCMVWVTIDVTPRFKGKPRHESNMC
jgi:hypothetical protein